MAAINRQHITSILPIILVLILAGCKKEAALQADETKDYMVNEDNPSDPVDHAIYEFYKATGVPVFYNDTIAREVVGTKDGQPVYFYHKLAINYSPMATALLRNKFFQLLSTKDSVLPMLPLLKDAVLPRLPTDILQLLHSMLIVGSIQTPGSLPQGYTSASNKPWAAFNTLMIPVVAPDTMTTAGRKTFIASILAVLAQKKLVLDHSKQLEEDFFSISRNTLPEQLIYRIPLSQLSPDGSKKAEDFGFIRFSYSNILLQRNIAPNFQDDLLTYLEAAFIYDTAAEFDATYESYPVVQNKFSVARALLRSIGFSFAD